jgi:hypothetical protein
MWHALPDEYLRAQFTVGALVMFGVARVLAAVIGAQRGWRIAPVTQWFLLTAAVFCLPQVLAMTSGFDTHAAYVALQGKLAGCALALFCAPIVSHRLGYE